jgi:thiol-disulfide isomerase/thioredoxin
MSLRKLTVDGLEKAIHQNAVVMYYASWCGHCRNATPIYQEVAERFSAMENTPCLITRFNMDKYHDIVEQRNIGVAEFGTPVHADVKGFPTFICYKKDGARSMYKGPRDVETMVRTIQAYYSS